MTIFRLLLAGALAFTFAHPANSVYAGDTTRTQEINECRNGEIATWNDGVDGPVRGSAMTFAYNASNAPARFPEPVVAGMIAKSAAAWGQCGIPSKMVSRTEAEAMTNSVIWVQWHEAESRGNFGLANLGQRTLSLGAKAFDLLNARNPRHDARETLQMVISHEMGHFFGLIAHSRRCVDVLSYYDDGKGQKCLKREPLDQGVVSEYRSSFPTACDIERCRKVNGR